MLLNTTLVIRLCKQIQLPCYCTQNPFCSVHQHGDKSPNTICGYRSPSPTHPRQSYTLEFSPLANASEFRASLRTRALRPFSFRVAAFGGSRDPFGFLPAADAGGAGGQVATAATADSPDSEAKCSAGKVLLRRDRWPYRLVDRVEGQRTGGTDALLIRETVRAAAEAETVGKATERRKSETEKSPTAREAGRAGGSDEAGDGHGDAGGGWRRSFSTALAIRSVTDEARLAEREHERCLKMCVARFVRRQLN